jgi:hypothetical protein
MNWNHEFMMMLMSSLMMKITTWCKCCNVGWEYHRFDYILSFKKSNYANVLFFIVVDSSWSTVVMEIKH